MSLKEQIFYQIAPLTPEQKARGIVTASTGNHGAAMAFGLNALKAKGLIFVPENASPTKIEAIKRLGGEIRTHGLDGAVTEVHARDYAGKHGMPFIAT